MMEKKLTSSTPLDATMVLGSPGGQAKDGFAKEMVLKKAP